MHNKSTLIRFGEDPAQFDVTTASNSLRLNLDKLKEGDSFKGDNINKWFGYCKPDAVNILDNLTGYQIPGLMKYLTQSINMSFTTERVEPDRKKDFGKPKSNSLDIS